MTTSIRRSNRRSLGSKAMLAGMIAAAVTAAVGARFANATNALDTWQGGTSANMGDGTNWVGGSPSGDGDTLIFTDTSNAPSGFVLTNNMNTTNSIKGITFNNTANSYTLNADGSGTPWYMSDYAGSGPNTVSLSTSVITVASGTVATPMIDTINFSLLTAATESHLITVTVGANASLVLGGTASQYARVAQAGAGPGTTGNMQMIMTGATSGTYGTLTLGGSSDNSFMNLTQYGGVVVLNKFTDNSTAIGGSVHAVNTAAVYGGTLVISGAYSTTNGATVNTQISTSNTLTVAYSGVVALNGNSQIVNSISHGGTNNGAANTINQTLATINNGAAGIGSLTIANGGTFNGQLQDGAGGGKLAVFVNIPSGTASQTANGSTLQLGGSSNTFSGGLTVLGGTITVVPQVELVNPVNKFGNGQGQQGNMVFTGTGPLTFANGSNFRQGMDQTGRAMTYSNLTLLNDIVFGLGTVVSATQSTSTGVYGSAQFFSQSSTWRWANAATNINTSLMSWTVLGNVSSGMNQNFFTGTNFTNGNLSVQATFTGNTGSGYGEPGQQTELFNGQYWDIALNATGNTFLFARDGSGSNANIEIRNVVRDGPNSSGSNFIQAGGGTLILTNANTYTGNTQLNAGGDLRSIVFNGSGSSAMSAGIMTGGFGRIGVDASTGTTSTARLASLVMNNVSDSGGVYWIGYPAGTATVNFLGTSIQSGLFAVAGTNNSNTLITTGDVVISGSQSGLANIIPVNPAGGVTNTITIGGNLVRDPNGAPVLNIVTDLPGFGQTTNAATGLGTTAKVMISGGSPPTNIGGGGAGNTSTASILPWAVAPRTGFLAYNATGGFFVAGSTAVLTDGNATLANFNGSATSATLNSATTLNSFFNTAATDSTMAVNAQLTINSGGLASLNPLNINGSGSLNFGSNEGVIILQGQYASTGGSYFSTMKINVPIAGSGGLTVARTQGNPNAQSTNGASAIILGAANTISGLVNVEGNSTTLILTNPLALQSATLNMVPGGAYAWGNYFTYPNGTGTRSGTISGTPLANASIAAVTGFSNLNVGKTVVYITGGDMTYSGVFQADNGTNSGYVGGSIIKVATNSTWNLLGTGTASASLETMGGTVNLGHASGAAMTALTIDAGLVTVTGTGNQFASVAGVAQPLTMNGGVFDINGQSQTVGDLLGAAGQGYITNQAAGTFAFLNFSGSNSNYSGVLANGTVGGVGTLGLGFSGGTLTASLGTPTGPAANYGGFNLNSGNLILNGSGALGVNTGTLSLIGGTLTVNNNMQIGNVVALNGTRATNTITATVAGSGVVEFDGVIMAPTSTLNTDSALNYVGTGTMVLANNNTYRGSTNVFAVSTASGPTVLYNPGFGNTSSNGTNGNFLTINGSTSRAIFLESGAGGDTRVTNVNVSNQNQSTPSAGLIVQGSTTNNSTTFITGSLNSTSGIGIVNVQPGGASLNITLNAGYVGRRDGTILVVNSLGGTMGITGNSHLVTGNAILAGGGNIDSTASDASIIPGVIITNSASPAVPSGFAAVDTNVSSGELSPAGADTMNLLTSGMTGAINYKGNANQVGSAGALLADTEANSLFNTSAATVTLGSAAGGPTTLQVDAGSIMASSDLTFNNGGTNVGYLNLGTLIANGTNSTPEGFLITTGGATMTLNTGVVLNGATNIGYTVNVVGIGAGTNTVAIGSTDGMLKNGVSLNNAVLAFNVTQSSLAFLEGTAGTVNLSRIGDNAPVNLAIGFAGAQNTGNQGNSTFQGIMQGTGGLTLQVNNTANGLAILNGTYSNTDRTLTLTQSPTYSGKTYLTNGGGVLRINASDSSLTNSAVRVIGGGVRGATRLWFDAYDFNKATPGTIQAFTSLTLGDNNDGTFNGVQFQGGSGNWYWRIPTLTIEAGGSNVGEIVLSPHTGSRTGNGAPDLSGTVTLSIGTYNPAPGTRLFLQISSSGGRQTFMGLPNSPNYVSQPAANQPNFQPITVPTAYIYFDSAPAMIGAGGNPTTSTASVIPGITAMNWTIPAFFTYRTDSGLTMISGMQTTVTNTTVALTNVLLHSSTYSISTPVTLNAFGTHTNETTLYINSTTLTIASGVFDTYIATKYEGGANSAINFGTTQGIMDNNYATALFNVPIQGTGGLILHHTSGGAVTNQFNYANPVSGDVFLSGIVGGGTPNTLLENASSFANATMNMIGSGNLVFGTSSSVYVLGALAGISSDPVAYPVKDIPLHVGFLGVAQGSANSAITLIVGNNNDSREYDGNLTGNGQLRKIGASIQQLGGSASAYQGVTQIWGGQLVGLQPDSIPGGPTGDYNLIMPLNATAWHGNAIQLSGGGVLGIGYDFFRSIGTSSYATYATGSAPGQIAWTSDAGNASGGLSAWGGTRNVSFGAGTQGLLATASVIQWNSTAGFVPTGATLSLGGANQTGILNLLNPLDLTGGIRSIDSGRGSQAYDAILAGGIYNGQLIKTGTGILAVSSGVSFTGNTQIQQGTFAVIGTASAYTLQKGFSGGGTLMVGPKAVANVSQTLAGGLNVAGSMTLTGNGTAGSQTNTLTIAGATNAWTGKLDIRNNLLAIQTPTASKLTTLATLRNQIATGLSLINGTNGSFGITSQTVLNNTNGNVTIALAYNGDYSIPKTVLQGVSLSTQSLIVVRALKGDGNLDGTVNIADFNILTGGYTKSNANWAMGDYNQDGTVNIADFNVLTGNYTKTLPAGLELPGVGAAVQAPSITTSQVPEPATLAVLAIGGAALLARRRRR